jgi:formate/nitrite transporter FocA (FNT family)
MLSRWAQVYLANFIGSILLAYIIFQAGVWKMGDGAVGAKALAIANAKVKLPFLQAFFSGIGCNWLVCLAVWMAFSAKDIAGKILAIFFPIMAFVALVPFLVRQFRLVTIC